MSMPSNIVGEVYRRLERIAQLAKEVEDIPNFGPDVWTMREGDEKCRQMQKDAAWVEQMVRTYIGTGDGGEVGATGGPPRW